MEKELIIENINTSKKLGVALKRLRKSKGLSQTELANMLGIRQPTISDIENGVGGTLDYFFKIVSALKANVAVSNLSNIKVVDKKSKAKKMIELLNES
jgi:transcriptional regulator with XRE-family HTH domain